MASDAELNFIRVDIKTGYTMLDLARTERLLAERDAATKAITNAEKALACAKRFMPALKNVGTGTPASPRRFR
jgi:hypothetical protein